MVPGIDFTYVRLDIATCLVHVLRSSEIESEKRVWATRLLSMVQPHDPIQDIEQLNMLAE